MPDGQIIARTSFPTQNVEMPPKLLRKAVPSSAAVYGLSKEGLLAQNTMLRSALERQQTKAADLRSILCSMDIATLCVCPGLKLRLCTAAAGRLLGIGPEQIGFPLSLCEPFGLGGTLLARIKRVLATGIVQNHGVALASGRLLQCRLLPLHAFATAEPAIDGVIITFTTTDVEVPKIGLPGQSLCVIPGPGNGGLAVGCPDLVGGLTPRQHQVLDHVLAGHPSKNIAADLGISRRTVENHRAAIMARTGATSLPALARLAIGADVGGDRKPAPSRRLCE